MEEKNVLLSIKDLQVKFRVRGRILTAIRGISLDIYENESIAIVGESGSGKSVFTKTFAGMLDSNGFISEGSIVFNDAELADTRVKLTSSARSAIEASRHKLDSYSKLELGAATLRELKALEREKEERGGLSDEEKAEADRQVKELVDERTDLYNLKQTFDPSKEKDKIKETAARIKSLDEQIKELKHANEQTAKEPHQKMTSDTKSLHEFEAKHAQLKQKYEKEISGEV